MDGTVLPEITKWLRGLSFPPSQWQEVYRNKRDFWVEFSNFTEKLLERRYVVPAPGPSPTSLTLVESTLETVSVQGTRAKRTYSINSSKAM